jgi:hypothetical protein
VPSWIQLKLFLKKLTDLLSEFKFTGFTAKSFLDAIFEEILNSMNLFCLISSWLEPSVGSTIKVSGNIKI